MTKAALYNYVSSKNDLLMQCYEVGMDRLIASVEQAMDTPRTLRRNGCGSRWKPMSSR